MYEWAVKGIIINLLPYYYHNPAVPSTRSYPTPGLLKDIPSVKTGQQLYTVLLL